MNECFVCGGRLEHKEVDVKRNWKGRRVVFQGIPADVCEECGEAYFAPEDTQLMEELTETAPADDTLPYIMNVRELAVFLRVSSQTIYNLLRSGKLTATKVGREWRFQKRQVIHQLRLAQGGNAGFESSVAATLPGLSVASFRKAKELSDNDNDLIFERVLETEKKHAENEHRGRP